MELWRARCVVKIVLAPASTRCYRLARSRSFLPRRRERKEFAELFDKYNLLTLPVVDEHNQLTASSLRDVIAMLRANCSSFIPGKVSIS